MYSLVVMFKSKSTLLNNKNIYRVRSAFITGLKRGFGCTFYTRDSFRAACTPSVPGTESLIALPEP